MPPHFDRYAKYSRLAKSIYAQYTDMVESFGLDECWLDVTGSTRLFGSGREIAEEIRLRIREELGLTVSVGVSFNKIFAKLGSDYRKPDAVTEITRENFREIVWPLDAGALLFNIYANGEDMAPVARIGEAEELKSVSNSTTAIHDLRDDGEIRAELYMLSESVAHRLREKGLSGYNVQLSVRKYNLETYQRQKMLDVAVADSESIFRAAYGLFRAHHTGESIRSIGVRVSSLVPLGMTQCSLFGDAARGQRMQKLETAVDFLRCKYIENPFKGVAV